LNYEQQKKQAKNVLMRISQ